jgi:predicted Ser/Thr protein kinase
VTLLVCSSCRARLAEGSTHCPRCGPGSLALLAGADLPPLARTADQEEQRLGRALGDHYRVIRHVGRGGFAEVYEVLDSDLQRRLAVKVLRADLPWGPGSLSRFKQEARSIARLSHPNTVPIHFVGEGEGLVYYAMPYLEGRSLGEILRLEGPLSVERVIAIAEPILDALQHAHQHGLVHRDVKPDNILIEAGTGRPLLVDFGIAKCLDAPSHVTDSGFIVGTPLYMSPEQAMGYQKVDARADIYGMGAVLFQLLTGAPPFEGDDSQEVVRRHVSEPVPVASLSREGIPSWLSRIVLRCMAKRPEDRYQSARDLLDALRAGKAAAGFGRSSMLREDETPTQTLRAVRRRPWRMWALAVAAACAVVVVPALARRPSALLVVQNRLTAPIALTLDEAELTIGAGDSLRIRVRGDRPLEAHWAMVQPASTEGRMLGEQVEGSILADRARGELRRIIDAETGDEPRFAPLVVNQTPRPLQVTLLTSGDSIACRCSVPPGDSLRLGYYRLAEASAVRVHDSRGWTGRFSILALPRDTVSGAVAIRVDPGGLKAPPSRGSVVRSQEPVKRSRSAPGSPPESNNPLRSILPVR